jgi:PAS domain S-box-containing protein
MIFYLSASTLFSLVLICVACFMAFIIWNRRPNRGAAPFAVFIVLISGWMLFRVLASAVDHWDLKVLLSKFTFLFLSGAAIGWLSFALDYCGLPKWRKPRYQLLLSAIPIISVILVTTSAWHGIEWLSLTPLVSAEGNFVVWDHKLLFWVQLIYLPSLVMLGYGLLWRSTLNRQKVFRRQIYFLFLGTLIPVVGMILFGIGEGYYLGLDVILITFSAGVIIYSLTIFHFRFLDVVPVARDVLVEIIPDGILVLNNRGTIQDINPAAEKILAVHKSETVGSQLSSVWPKLDVIFDKLKPGRDTEIMVEQSYLELSRAGLTDKRGSPVGQLVVLRDITQRRLMEQTLRESEVRYMTLVEQSNEMVIIIQEGIIKFANHTVCQGSGYSVDEMVGMPFLNLIANEDREMVAQRYRQRMSGENVPDIYEFSVICKSGEKRDLEAYMGVITFEEKTALLSTARDVTERKLTQRKLESLYQQEKELRGHLQHEIDKRSKYTRALVHELNTPLTSILASGELLESEVKEPVAAATVKNIRDSSFSLKSRIDELIELARGETGLLKINAMPIDITRLIADFENEMRPRFQQQGLDFKKEITGVIPLAMGDEGFLRQVLTNLVNYLGQSAAPVMIELKVQRAGDFVRVSLKNPGQEIGPEELKNLFDPYQKRNSNSTGAASGLGLALSRIFVELHGGKLEVENEAGQGSVFHFTVPLYNEADLIKKFSAKTK